MGFLRRDLDHPARNWLFVFITLNNPQCMCLNCDAAFVQKSSPMHWYSLNFSHTQVKMPWTLRSWWNEGYGGGYRGWEGFKSTTQSTQRLGLVRLQYHTHYLPGRFSRFTYRALFDDSVKDHEIGVSGAGTLDRSPAVAAVPHQVLLYHLTWG